MTIHGYHVPKMASLLIWVILRYRASANPVPSRTATLI